MSKRAFAARLAFVLSLSGAPAVVHAADLQTVTFATTGTGANYWPIYVAQDMGYFKKGGIALDWIQNPSSSSSMQQLAAGSVEISSNGLVDPLRAIDKGAPITLLGIEMTPAPYEVYAKPDIHSFAELKGKKVIIGGIKDITRVYFERMAGRKNLPPGSYDLVFAGTTAARMSALVSGSVDAAILLPPFNFDAAAAHFSRLPPTPNFSKGAPFSGLSVNLAWAKSHQQLIAKFLAAFSQGVDWFYDPAHKQDAINLLVRNLSMDRRQAEKTYDFYVALQAFDRDATITKDSIGPLLASLKAQGDIDGSTEFSRFYNPAAIGLAR